MNIFDQSPEEFEREIRQVLRSWPLTADPPTVHPLLGETDETRPAPAQQPVEASGKTFETSTSHLFEVALCWCLCALPLVLGVIAILVAGSPEGVGLAHVAGRPPGGVGPAHVAGPKLEISEEAVRKLEWNRKDQEKWLKRLHPELFEERSQYEGPIEALFREKETAATRSSGVRGGAPKPGG
jgi:hypothetical protein